MKKIIHLRDENNHWKEHQYKNIHDLKEELQKRNISIGVGSTIGDDATIGNGATIRAGAFIGVGAIIWENATIGESATIGLDAIIGTGTNIGLGAYIGLGAFIGDGALIGERAIIGNGAFISSGIKILIGLYINGSKHPLTYTGGDTVSVGCEKHSIDTWLNQFEIIGKKENYTDDEIKEYKGYLDIFKLFIENKKVEQ